jgi:hypothetical protein
MAARVAFPAVKGLVATPEMAWGIQYFVYDSIPAQVKKSKKMICSIITFRF